MSLESQSESFHAFEWLREEAMKGNHHAQNLMIRISNHVKESVVPGVWYCPKCNFVESRNIMYTGSGNIGADTTITDTACPNDGELMLQMTWKRNYETVSEVCKIQVKRACQAETKVEALQSIAFRMSLILETIGTTTAEEMKVIQTANEILKDYRIITALPITSSGTPASDDR